jgi:type IV pilus assembly protein PilF
MSTLRGLVFCAVCIALQACAGGGGTRDERSSDENAAIANMNLGAGYLRQGRIDLAIERLLRALDQDPRLVDAHSTIAIAYDQLGSPADAENHYRRATQLDAGNAAAANSYAVFLCRQSRWPDAEPYFKRAAGSGSYTTPEVALTNAGVCARNVGNTEAAERYFRDALTRSPTYQDALSNLMQMSYQNGNFMQARAFVQRYLGAHPPTAPVLWMCFNVERELDDRAAADRCATQLRAGFQGSAELRQLEEQQSRDGR